VSTSDDATFGPGRTCLGYPFVVALRFETRSSDSPWVDTVWTCTSEQVAEMTSVATVCWGLVFWDRDGTASACITGPETKTGTAPVPEDATFVGIEFAVGTSLRAVSPPALVDQGIELSNATRRAFQLDRPNPRLRAADRTRTQGLDALGRRRPGRRCCLQA
jgi:hypothetical protein